MRTKRLDRGIWFEQDFAVPGSPGDYAQLMVRSPTEAVMLFWVPTPKPDRKALEGMHLLEFTRADLDADWHPSLFEGRHDWWLAGSGQDGRRHPEVADLPALRTVVDAALDILADREADVLKLGAERLVKEADEARERWRKRSVTRPAPAQDRTYVEHLAARMLSPDEAATLAPSFEAYGFGGVLETRFGPVSVHIETGPVVRIDAVPGVLLVAEGENGPYEFLLTARWSTAGWADVRPKSDEAAKAADEILEIAKRTFAPEIRAAFKAWACSTLAKDELAQAASARSEALAEEAFGRLERRASDAEERRVRMTEATGPRP